MLSPSTPATPTPSRRALRPRPRPRRARGVEPHARPEDGLVDHWRIATEAERTGDELAVLLQGFLALRASRSTTSTAWPSSGVPRVKESLRLLADRYLEFDPVMIEPGVRTGIAILAENPKEVGADRIANAVAAYDLFGDRRSSPTSARPPRATVSANGEYLGGAIAPGIGISMDALVGGAAALRAVELVEPAACWARHGRVHPVRRGLRLRRPGRRLVRAHPGRARRVHHRLDRGLAGLITPLSKYIERCEPWLTLYGLRLVYEKNV